MNWDTNRAALAALVCDHDPHYAVYRLVQGGVKLTCPDCFTPLYDWFSKCTSFRCMAYATRLLRKEHQNWAYCEEHGEDTSLDRETNRAALAALVCEHTGHHDYRVFGLIVKRVCIDCQTPISENQILCWWNGCGEPARVVQVIGLITQPQYKRHIPYCMHHLKMRGYQDRQNKVNFPGWRLGHGR